MTQVDWVGPAAPRRVSVVGDIFEHERATVSLGDARELLEAVPSNSFDSCVSDPPYELEFMEQKWDASGIAFDPLFWAQLMRTLKPGAYLVAFGAPRTWHRLAVAIEDGGFELRDSLAWLYGTGFPKSLNLPGGLGTALKPAFEPIVLARKPLIGTLEANVAAWGTGALNIDACRLGGGDTRAPRNGSSPGFNHAAGVMCGSALGRWPANVAMDEEAGALLDVQAGSAGAHSRTTGDEPSAAGTGLVTNFRRRVKGAFHADEGGASRFFYSAKTSARERNIGCEHLEAKSGGEATGRRDGAAALSSPRSGAGRGGGAKNFHPTVKPVSLMRWLVRLVTPAGGQVLDPFTGSGSTGIASLLEHRRFVGFELTEDYAPIIAGRLQAALEGRFR